MSFIKRIKLKNFRNYAFSEINFSDGINILKGKNAAGKTNILEAIQYFGILKSFRSVSSSDLILYNADTAYLKLETENHTFEAGWEKSSRAKNLKIDDKKAKTIDFLKNFCTVLFTPDDLLLVSGEPSRRRNFLDALLVRIDPHFAIISSKYRLAIKNRNSLLIQNSTDTEFDYWEEKITKLGTEIWQKRKALVSEINTILKSSADDFPPAKNLYINMDFPSFTTDEQKFLEALVAKRSYDKKRGSTSIGPHRDDWQADLKEKNLKLFGSRGEQRSAVIALKFAEAKIIETEKKELPVLLLDDIFSELDESRSQFLGKFLSNHQVILTCTETPPMDYNQVLEISEGKIKTK